MSINVIVDMCVLLRLLSSVQHGSPVPVPNVLEQGEWLVSEGIREKRLAVTRTALMEQLTETEAFEAKANLKVCKLRGRGGEGVVGGEGRTAGERRERGRGEEGEREGREGGEGKEW